MEGKHMCHKSCDKSPAGDGNLLDTRTIQARIGTLKAMHDHLVMAVAHAIGIERGLRKKFESGRCPADMRQQIWHATSRIAQTVRDLAEWLFHEVWDRELLVTRDYVDSRGEYASEEDTVKCDLDGLDLRGEALELRNLLELKAEVEEYTDQWDEGTTLVRASHFQEYVRESLDTPGLPRGLVVDWAATVENLRERYTAVHVPYEQAGAFLVRDS